MGNIGISRDMFILDICSEMTNLSYTRYYFSIWSAEGTDYIQKLYLPLFTSKNKKARSEEKLMKEFTTTMSYKYKKIKKINILKRSERINTQKKT